MPRIILSGESAVASDLEKNLVVSVETLNDFLSTVTALRKSWDFDEEDIGGPWYRGQQRKHWRLLPNINRIGCTDRETQDEIREEFATRASALSRYESLPTNEWDLYFLMQHYGAPTRLLDWTESPIIALYFAVRDNPGYYDSAVWMLDPYKLNHHAIGKREVISPGALGANPVDIKRVAPWLPPRWSRNRIPASPVAIFPTHIARRISSQKSCFTVHGTDENGFESFSNKKGKRLKKIIIPSHAVRDVKLNIREFGIDDTTIFPDLEGLGRALASAYQDIRKESPHRDVYVRLRASPLKEGGVGLVAIKPIPRDTRLFADENEEMVWLPEETIPKTGSIRKLYDDFAIIRGDRYGCPISFNRLTPAWFINDSISPNTRIDENYDFFALRNIKAGEELTVSHSSFSDEPATPSPRSKRQPKPGRRPKGKK